MQIGTFARHHNQLEQALEYEPDFIDLRMDMDYSIKFDEVKKILAEHGTSCTLHLPSSPDWKPIDIGREIIPYIDLGVEIDASLVTFHTALSSLFYEDEDIDAFLETVPLACDAANEQGITIAVETLGLYYTELAMLIDKCPKIQVALDIGHGQIMANKNRAVELIMAFSDRIAMVNVHDNTGSDMVEEVQQLKIKRSLTCEDYREIAIKYDTHQAIGEGNIDFDCIFRELKERSYDGKFLMMCGDPTKFPTERTAFTDSWLAA